MGGLTAPSRANSRKSASGRKTQAAGDAKDVRGSDHGGISPSESRADVQADAAERVAYAGSAAPDFKRDCRGTRGSAWLARRRKTQTGSIGDSPTAIRGHAGAPKGSRSGAAGAAGRAAEADPEAD